MIHYIDARVHDPDLTPACIASYFNTSLRGLYRLVAAAGSSPAAFIRFRSSRQESPASTSRVVLGDAMTVELPLEPEARTVMRMQTSIRSVLVGFTGLTGQ